MLYERFVPTFDRQSGLPAADPRVNDPAAILAVAQDGEPARRSAGAAADVDRPRRRLARDAAALRARTAAFSIGTIPGIPLVGIGAFVLLTGLIVSFYFLPARLYVRVDETAPQRCRVGVAATTVKGYDVFENEFARLVRSVNEGLGRTRRRGCRSARLGIGHVTKMSLDEVLMVTALGSYVLAALALLAISSRARIGCGCSACRSRSSAARRSSRS